MNTTKDIDTATDVVIDYIKANMSLMREEIPLFKVIRCHIGDYNIITNIISDMTLLYSNCKVKRTSKSFSGQLTYVVFYINDNYCSISSTTKSYIRVYIDIDFIEHILPTDFKLVFSKVLDLIADEELSSIVNIINLKMTKNTKISMIGILSEAISNKIKNNKSNRLYNFVNKIHTWNSMFGK